MITDQPVPFLIRDGFLDREELSGLLDYTLAHEDEFGPSGLIDPKTLSGMIDPEFRRSLGLADLGRYREMITNSIESTLPHILAELRRAHFSSSLIETMLVASNDGEFFKRHNDTGCAHRTREISFVYYFHREPRAFQGGELRIYTSFVRAIVTRTPVRAEDIAPLQNRMVFFPSSMMHEVLPVQCSSRAFADSRFSVTGWIHK